MHACEHQARPQRKKERKKERKKKKEKKKEKKSYVSIRTILVLFMLAQREMTEQIR